MVSCFRWIKSSTYQKRVWNANILHKISKLAHYVIRSNKLGEFEVPEFTTLLLSGSGSLVCKRFAVQTLFWSMKFLIIHKSWVSSKVSQLRSVSLLILHYYFTRLKCRGISFKTWKTWQIIILFHSPTCDNNESYLLCK